MLIIPRLVTASKTPSFLTISVVKSNCELWCNSVNYKKKRILWRDEKLLTRRKLVTKAEKSVIFCKFYCWSCNEAIDVLKHTVARNDGRMNGILESAKSPQSSTQSCFGHLWILIFICFYNEFSSSPNPRVFYFIGRTQFINFWLVFFLSSLLSSSKLLHQFVLTIVITLNDLKKRIAVQFLRRPDLVAVQDKSDYGFITFHVNKREIIPVTGFCIINICFHDWNFPSGSISHLQRLCYNII